MTKIALIVEGKGDVDAAAALAIKTAAEFGGEVQISDPPIRAGEARKLRREGELERMVRLAMSRDGVEAIVVLLDMDDDCAADFHAEFAERAAATARHTGIPVKVCFCVREFECWFLCDVDSLIQALPDYGWTEDAVFPNPEAIRGAKERLSRVCRTKGYRQTRDQTVFAKAVNIRRLTLRSRSFRKFVKAITDLSYEEIQHHASTPPAP